MVAKKKFGGKQEGAGRPLKELNEEQVYKLAQTLLPIETIASILGTSVDTLDRRFSGVLQAGRSNRKETLSQVMWHKALVEKSEKMMIWLSKQHLGYKDTQPEEVPTTNFIVHIHDDPK
jgi:hypothetical protein